MHFHRCEDEVLKYVQIDGVVGVQIKVAIEYVASEFGLSSKGSGYEESYYERETRTGAFYARMWHLVDGLWRQ